MLCDHRYYAFSESCLFRNDRVLCTFKDICRKYCRCNFLSKRMFPSNNGIVLRAYILVGEKPSRAYILNYYPDVEDCEALKRLIPLTRLLLQKVEGEDTFDDMSESAALSLCCSQSD